MTDVFDSLELGRQARDEGMARVVRAKWRADYISAFNQIPLGAHGIPESFHTLMRHLGLQEPHHPNAWGANWRRLVEAKLVIPTGETGQMRRPKAHARAHCPVFQKVAHG